MRQQRRLAPRYLRQSASGLSGDINGVRSALITTSGRTIQPQRTFERLVAMDEQQRPQTRSRTVVEARR